MGKYKNYPPYIVLMAPWQKIYLTKIAKKYNLSFSSIVRRCISARIANVLANEKGKYRELEQSSENEYHFHTRTLIKKNGVR